MAGKTIKQLDSRTSPALTDYLYLVAGTDNYNVTLDKIKELFNIEDVDGWQTEIIEANSTAYIQLLEVITYAGTKIEYLVKRGNRKYHAGEIIIINDGTDVNIEDNWDNIDEDDNGISFDAESAAGYLQLNITADNSDVNDTSFIYRIKVKKPL